MHHVGHLSRVKGYVFKSFLVKMEAFWNMAPYRLLYGYLAAPIQRIQQIQKYLCYTKHKCGENAEVFNGKSGKYSIVNTVSEGFTANPYSHLRALFLNPEPNILFK